MAASSSCPQQLLARFMTIARCSNREPMQSLTAKKPGASVLPSRLLAAHGHPAGQAAAGRTLGQREGALEDMVNPWQGRRVFLTGHTGFKGGWLALWLAARGAKIRGYALDPATEPNLFTAASVAAFSMMFAAIFGISPSCSFDDRVSRPEVVFHLAAQPLGATFVCRSAGNICDQCDGHGACAGSCAQHPDACERSFASPPTSATRIRNGSGRIAKPILSEDTTPTPPAKPALKS